MDKFECNCVCEQDECAMFHNPPRPPCNCIRQISKSTKFIERLLDCTESIVRVLTICGIHECKAKASAEVILFAFLHYDIVPDPVSDVLLKKLRKVDVFHDLGRKCRMNRVEAHLAYSIIKRAFKAFYYKQMADMYNPDYVDEFQWMQAAKRSAEVYACTEGLTEPERKKLENRIKCTYCSYIERIYASRVKDNTTCKCCFCNKCQPFGGKGFKVYSSELPKEDEEIFRYKKKLLEESRKKSCAPPDPCGLRMLEEQTQWKAEKKRDCRCAAEDCLCAHAPDCEDMCAHIPLEEGIAVDWACMPSDDKPPEKDCMPQSPEI